MARRRAMLAVAVVLAPALAGTPCGSTAHADEPSTLEWLANEPVTLFDLGMLRLREDLDDAAQALTASESVSSEPRTGVFYQWRKREITAYVTLRERFTDPTEAGCRETFKRVRDTLLADVPAGPRSAEVYLETLFTHPGFGNWGRPRRLGADLVEMVRFEVTLLPPPPAHAGGRRVQCSGPLNTEPEDLVMD